MAAGRAAGLRGQRGRPAPPGVPGRAGHESPASLRLPGHRPTQRLLLVGAGCQAPDASATERGKWVGEKLIAPAGTIHGSTLTEKRPALTAGSASLSSRARSGSTLRIDSPRK